MYRALWAVVLATCLFVTPSQAQSNITIIPTYDAFITARPVIVSTLNAALAEYTSTFTSLTPVTIRLGFQNTTLGLGSSSTFVFTTTYSNWRTALGARVVSADDISSFAFIPNQPTSPINNAANVSMSRANARVLGLVGAVGTNDTTISLNFGLMNWDRLGAAGSGNNFASGHYDLKAVAQHETDEALGSISGVGGATPWGADYTRFGSSGTFSYTTNTTAPAYFSVNGGATNLVNYNQRNGNSGDYGDFMVNSPPHVQDWAGTPNSTPNLNVELRLLDVVGYSFIAVPEPSTVALFTVLGVGLASSWYSRRKQLAKLADQCIAE